VGYQFYEREESSGPHRQEFWDHAQEAPASHKGGLKREVVLGEPEPDLQNAGRYSIVRYLRTFGNGEVYLAAYDGDATQLVALKCLHPGVRLELNRRDLASLGHKYLARFYDSGAMPDDRRFVAYEYLEGRSLAESCLDRRLTLLGRARRFCRVCAAVEYLHDKGIVHRGITSANIGTYRGGEPKLTGLELAGRMRHPDAVADINSDIYMLSLTLHELLSGLPASSGAGWKAEAPSHRLAGLDKETLSHIAGQRRMAADDMISIFASKLDPIFTLALNDDPGLRYPSVAELKEDVQRALGISNRRRGGNEKESR
jgi:serine/threonine protein kinase